MTGANNEVVETLSKEFNESQSEYKVVPVFKGTYPETLNAGIAAFRAKQPPHILQVFDVGTGVMMGAEGAIKPVAEVLAMGGTAFDKSQYLPGIVSYYSKPDGTMLSFPYNSLLADPLLQQGHLPEGRARRRQSAEDLAGSLGSRARRSRPAARRPAATPRPGSPGSTSRTSPPGTTCPTAPTRTASPAPTSS